ncbi:unnamed protein product, partial [Porites evermanni]
CCPSLLRKLQTTSPQEVLKNYRGEQFSNDIAHIPWNTVGCVMESVDGKVNAFNDLFLTCLDNHAPIKTVKLKRKPNPSITSEDCLSDKPGKLLITKQVDPASVLVYFDNSKETVLSVDASNISLCAVFMQEHRPDAFSLKNCLGEDVG